ncbi:hypothetical protein [Enterovirga sp.]|uniref:hypothetical protein n=1 Tax=Enterovirga sp. TaxID=2026350 RepID=UPI002C06B6AC|nr:hypothetical protein [Enterovirga sp.]HMO28181.1 hypothetical protein [Enterovirga sp.]
MRVAIAVLVAAWVAGCQTKPVGEMTHSEMKTLADEIAQRCMSRVAKRNSPEMDACIKQESRREIAARAR